jgi:hypothetical protein
VPGKAQLAEETHEESLIARAKSAIVYVIRMEARSDIIWEKEVYNEQMHCII